MKRALTGSSYKTLAVLRQFSDQAAEFGVTDLSQLTGIDKASVFRALRALAAYRFVEQNPLTKKYHLGFAVLELAGAKLGHMPLVSAAKSHLAKLAQQTGETVQMSVLDQDCVLYISVIESPQPIRVSLGVGTRAPLYCTAAGLVLLANASTSTQDLILSRPLKKFTPRTIVEASQLKRQLSLVRNRGWSEDDQGFVDHLRVVAAPVREPNGNVISAVAVGGPTIRVTREKLKGFSGLVVATATAISQDLASRVLNPNATAS